MRGGLVTPGAQLAPRKPSRVRWGCIVAALLAPIVVGIAGVVGVYLLTPSWMRPNTEYLGGPTEPRALRLAPPEPLGQLPLGGGEGLDRYGYPLKSADAVALRSLLLAGQFTQLTQYLERFQLEAEADFHREYWILDALDAFDTADLQVGRRIDAWARQAPGSFAPHLARGMHLRSLAHHQRGYGSIAETSEERVAAMHAHTLRAIASLRRAIELRPRLFVADIGLIRASSLVGDRATKSTAYAHAIDACPLCVSPRKVFMYLSRPRWGGSLESMAAIADEANQRAADNPRLATLRGFVDWEAGETFAQRHQYPQAIAAYDRALQSGELEDFYDSRGSAELRAGDTSAAVADYDRARALRPARVATDDEVLTLLRARRGEAAVSAYVRAQLLDPTDEELQEYAPDVSQAAAYVGWQHFNANRPTEALSWLDLARQIDPDNADARNRFLWAARQHGTRVAASMAATEERARSQPDSFEAVRDLDYALSSTRVGNYLDRIAGRWDAYIARHPRDARAFVERSGTLANMGNHAGAIRDAVVACHLGNRVGCQEAEQLRAMQASGMLAR